MGPTGKGIDNISFSPSRARSLLGYEEILESFLLGVMRTLAKPDLRLLDNQIPIQEPN